MKKKSGLNLNTRLTILFIGAALVLTAAILLVTQRAYTSQMIRETYMSEYTSLEMKSQLIDAEIKQYDMILSQIYNDAGILSILRMNSVDANMQYMDSVSFIHDSLDHMIYPEIASHIESIVVASPKKLYTYYDEGGFISEYNNSFMERLEAESGRLVLFDTDTFPVLWSASEHVFALGRFITDPVGHQKIGYEIIFLSQNIFKPYFQMASNEKQSSYYILSDAGNVMYVSLYPELNITAEEIKDLMEYDVTVKTADYQGGKVLLVRQVSEYTGWTYVSITPLDPLMSTINCITRTTILFAVLFVASVLIVVRSVVRSILLPIGTMEKVVQEIGNGDLTLRLPEYDMPDIRNLGQQFNLMLDKIDQLVRDNSEKQAVLHRTEIQMLQAQINPHFLYNTLNSIRWLAIFNGQEQIKTQIDSLTALLRATLSDGREEFPLREELELLKSYVEIMRIRYYNFSMQYEYNQEQVLDNCVPRFILQPVVENAILHGFSELEKEGEIYIRAGTKEAVLWIEVIDNGSGISRDSIDEVMRSEGKLNHIGIHNVDQRLKMMYGEEYGILIVSTEGEGTTVRIEIPAHSAEAEIHPEVRK